jgi:Chromate transporter
VSTALPPSEGRDSLAAIFVRFLKFGALAWGGPAAQIAMIKHECVDEEHWVSEESFKKTLAVFQSPYQPSVSRVRSLLVRVTPLETSPSPVLTVPVTLVPLVVSIGIPTRCPGRNGSDGRSLSRLWGH